MRRLMVMSAAVAAVLLLSPGQSKAGGLGISFGVGASGPCGGGAGFGFGAPSGYGFSYGVPYGAGYSYGVPYAVGGGFGNSFGFGQGFGNSFGVGGGFGNSFGFGQGFGNSFGFGQGFGNDAANAQGLGELLALFNLFQQIRGGGGGGGTSFNEEQVNKLADRVADRLKTQAKLGNVGAQSLDINKMLFRYFEEMKASGDAKKAAEKALEGIKAPVAAAPVIGQNGGTINAADKDRLVTPLPQIERKRLTKDDVAAADKLLADAENIRLATATLAKPDTTVTAKPALTVAASR